MIDLNKELKEAEENLNQCLVIYESHKVGLELIFTELKIQAAIFQFDICYELTALHNSGLKNFAESVALKGIVLRLYEYDKILNKLFIPSLLSLAKSRNIPIDSIAIRELRKEWKSELKQLKEWKNIRNEAAGHYGKNLSRQLQLLKTLNFETVMGVTCGFLSFNMGLLRILKESGKGNV